MVLDKLKIGNTEMKIHEPTKDVNTTTNQKITAVNTWTTVNTYTITEKGVYFIKGDIMFAAASSTGVTKHASRLRSLNGGGTLVSASRADGDNSNVTTTVNGVIDVTTVPHEYSLDAFCSRTITTGFETSIRIFKLYDLGD